MGGIPVGNFFRDPNRYLYDIARGLVYYTKRSETPVGNLPYNSYKRDSKKFLRVKSTVESFLLWKWWYLTTCLI